MVQGNALVGALSVLLAIIVGGVLIAATDPRVSEAAGYFLARPGDLFSAIWQAVGGAYGSLLKGSVFNPSGATLAEMFNPLSETLTTATPLILAALGVAVAFRAGLFNIGAQGQIMLGAVFTTLVAIHLPLPTGIHLLAVILAGAAGGALWGSIAGLLKAWTGAHEVIVTIMLNYIALNLVLFLLGTPALQRPGASNPISPIIPGTAAFPHLLGEGFRLHGGFVMAILATVFVWWLMNRSTLGFELKAVGANPAAARNAGIHVARSYVVVMAIAGAFAGLAGVAQVSGTEKVLTAGVAASVGFDAITVALLGRSSPLGTFLAGLLFGAFRAGGQTMQIDTGTPVDIVLVVQSLIVLFIAAPPLVRAIFRLKDPSRPSRPNKKAVKGDKPGAPTTKARTA